MMSMKAIVSVTATVSTIGQFLTGISICSRVKRQGEAGDVSCLPFSVGCVGCAVWLKYSLMIEDVTMALVNSVGLLLQLSYLVFYYQFCMGSVSLTAVRRQLLSVVLLLSCVFWYTDVYHTDGEARMYRLGCIGAASSIGFTAAPLVSLGEVFRTRTTAILPFPLIAATFVVMLQWFLYGCLINDRFVQVPNLVGTVVSGLQLLLFVVFPRDKKILSSSVHI